MTDHEAEISPKNRYTGSAVSWVKTNEAALIDRWRSVLGVDISAHRPSDLHVADAQLNPRFRAFASKSPQTHEANIIAVGCFLGEVIVRNLGGRWHAPNYLQVLAMMVRANSNRAEKYMYVTVGNEKVYVFRAAREAIEKTGAVFSLYDFYLGYARRRLSFDGEASP